MPADPKLIRNFSIIAHIDHGKSTLADRILEHTGALTEREKQDQFLDKMELERERGITIKAQTVRLDYTAKDGQTYRLHLIDTPGHVDFHYEVSRSLQACEGALLVVDASQGVEAQTLANVFLALDNNLEIIPVLNKVDLPSADTDRTKREIEDVIGLDCANAIPASAKTGLGVGDIVEAVIQRVPPPKGDAKGPLRALIFDSWYDSYRGAVVMVRVVDGSIRKGQKVRFMATGRDYELTEMGIFTPHATPITELGPGEVGFLAANIKSVVDTKIGDTVTDAVHPATVPLPGFKEVKPMVFAGIYPTDSAQYEDLRDALSKLNMNDAAFVFEPDTSEALGFGFRCGFLGLLHMEIIQERLEREYNLDLITTAPSVAYRVPDRRVDEDHREPGEDAAHAEHGQDRRAHLPGDDPRACEPRGRGALAVSGAARRAEVDPVRVLRPRDHHLRHPAERGALRLSRQAQERLTRLRFDGLRARGLSGR